METIKNITAEAGEECKVDIEILHETLTKLPAKMYLELYRKMYEKIYGLPPFLGFNGGCCGTIGEIQEDNAKHYKEQPKISKSYAVGWEDKDMSPEEFYEKMLQLKNDFGDDEEMVHIKMDDLLCKVLSELGYGDGVEVFNETGKWFS